MHINMYTLIEDMYNVCVVVWEGKWGGGWGGRGEGEGRMGGEGPFITLTIKQNLLKTSRT